MPQKVVIAVVLCLVGIVCLRAAFLRFRKRLRKRRGRGRFDWRKQVAVVVAVVLLITGAAGATVYLIKNKETEIEMPDPTLPGSVGSVDDFLPGERDSAVWKLLYDGTYRGLETEAIKLDGEIRMIVNMLETAKSEGKEFELPVGFHLHPAKADSKRQTAGSLEEYDGQLTDEVANKEYYWTTITALNCLDFCTNSGEQDKTKYEYYSELAIWGLVNQYVALGEDASKELVDLFYRAGQVFDHLGGSETGATKQGLYFVSAAFLELAFLELVHNGFHRGEVYQSDCSNLYFTMLKRLSLNMKDSAGYSKRTAEKSALIPPQ